MKAADVRSLGALFFHHVDQFRFDPLLQGEGVSYSTDRFKGAVFALAGFFQSHGLKPGDRVAVLSENRPEWHVADFALHVSGLISVPLYTAFSPSQVRYVLEHSGAVALAVALSFGLGGREAAGRQMEYWLASYRKGGNGAGMAAEPPEPSHPM